MDYPYLRRRDRGSGTGRREIVFSEDHGYDEAAEFAARLVKQLGLTLEHRIDGPDAWIWEVRGTSGRFRFGYDDYPCETTLWAADPHSDPAVERLFNDLVAAAPPEAGEPN